MMYTMVGGGEDDLLQESHPAVPHDIFSYMDKGAPGAVDGHDEEEQRGIYACYDTNGSADHIRIRGFQKEMHIGDGEVHALRCVVSGMKAPEKAYFMTEIVIDKMGQFPDDVPIDEPVPFEGGVEGSVLFQETDTKGYGCNGDEAGDAPVGNKYKKGHPVVFDPESFIYKGAYDLDEEKEGNHRRDGGEKPLGCRQRGVISFVVHFQQGIQAGEAKQFVVERVQNVHVQTNIHDSV